MTSVERRQRRTVAEKLRVLVPLAITWTVGIVIMAAVATQPGDRAGEMLMDPTFTLGTKWYTGLVSNLGVLTWTVAAAAAFAGAWLCRLGDRRRAGRFLFAGGVVGTVLLADDLFLFHSVLAPAELGIPKAAAQVAIGVLIIWWAYSHVAEVARTHVHLLVAAAAGLGGSFVVDAVFAPAPGSGWSLLEDGAKFLGVLAWATYFVVTTRDISRSVFVDALMTWPDEAYDSVYGVLEDVTELPGPASDQPAHLG